MGLTPTRVLVKDVMIYPAVGKYYSNCGTGRVSVADYLSTCPVAVSTLICEALVLGGP